MEAANHLKTTGGCLKRLDRLSIKAIIYNKLKDVIDGLRAKIMQ